MNSWRLWCLIVKSKAVDYSLDYFYALSGTLRKFCINILMLGCIVIDAVGQTSPVLGRLDIGHRLGNGIALINVI